MLTKVEKEKESRSLTFQIDCEWLCNFVRQRVYYEGVEYSEGLKILKSSFNDLTSEQCDDILKGKKKIVGINCGILEDDDKFSDYEKYLSRYEANRQKIELREHMAAYPYNYIDPFATCYSIQEFERIGNPKTLMAIEDYFVKHKDLETDRVNDLSGTLLRGGTYSISDYYAKEMVLNEDDKQNFYNHLYQYWKKELDENSWLYGDSELNEIRRRQRNYEASLKKIIDDEMWESRINAQIVLDKMKRNKVKEKGYFDYFDSSIIDEEDNLEFRPTRKFSDYGIIDPQGNFFSVGFGNHAMASKKIADQRGIWYSDDKEDLNSDGLAKDKLFNLGYIFVNLNGSQTLFYGKYVGTGVPQKQLDTMFDYNEWDKTVDR